MGNDLDRNYYKKKINYAKARAIVSFAKKLEIKRL